MDKKYLKWLRDVRSTTYGQYFGNTFFVWVRHGQWRSLYNQGLDAGVASTYLIPF